MRRGLLIIGTLLLVVGLTVLLYINQRNTPSRNINPTGLSTGVIYTITLADANGNLHALGKWGQKLLIINFWATWCAPCKEEIPLLIDMQDRYGKMIQIVGIAFDNALNVSNFTKEIAINYPSLLDQTGALELSKRFGNHSGLLPYSVIVHPQHGIIFTHVGKIERSQIDGIIAKFAAMQH